MMGGVREWLRRLGGRPAQPPQPEDLREPREGARTYVLCGDNMWGCSILWQFKPGEVPGHEGDGTYGRVCGWLSHPMPERGDVIVARMGGGAGRWVVQSVERQRNPGDMFLADVRGVIGYLDPPPEFKRATELLEPAQRGEFV